MIVQFAAKLLSLLCCHKLGANKSPSCRYVFFSFSVRSSRLSIKKIIFSCCCVGGFTVVTFFLFIRTMCKMCETPIQWHQFTHTHLLLTLKKHTANLLLLSTSGGFLFVFVSFFLLNFVFVLPLIRFLFSFFFSLICSFLLLMCASAYGGPFF